MSRLSKGCRALLFTQPLVAWRSGELAGESHNKISNLTSNNLSEVSQAFKVTLMERFRKAKKAREAFSYKFPADGLTHFEKFIYNDLSVLIEDCTVLIELAQLNSECLDACFEHLKPQY